MWIYIVFLELPMKGKSWKTDIIDSKKREREIEKPEGKKSDLMFLPFPIMNNIVTDIIKVREGKKNLLR